MRGKVVPPLEAVALIPAGGTVVVDGSGGGVNQPDRILRALRELFDQTGTPSGLTVVHPSGLGDGLGGGVDRLAHPRLVRRVVGGHWGWTPEMQKLASANAIEAYCLPQGVLSHLMREIAGGRPGVITKVGMHTTCDPRLEGGKFNSISEEDLVEVVTLLGEEWLLYKSCAVDATIIKASYADERGNLCMDDEGLPAEVLSSAQAAKNSGGVVLAQVPYIVAAGSIDPRRVAVPGILVDAVVVEPLNRLSAATVRDPTLTGEARAPRDLSSTQLLTERLVIARRAAAEIRDGDIVNLGYGMADGVAHVLAVEGATERVSLTVEQGHVGGTPVGGSDFGLVRNAEATIHSGYQFDFYDGGGLDVAVLSFAEVDSAGNVNVGKFGGRLVGVGGFINIAQGAKRVIFVGTMTVSKSGYHFDGDRVRLRVPNGETKFVKEVQQITFSGKAALERGQSICYVTERAVFELTSDGVALVEMAPGLDLRADILDNLDFEPVLSEDVRLMDPRIFQVATSGYVSERLGRTSSSPL